MEHLDERSLRHREVMVEEVARKDDADHFLRQGTAVTTDPLDVENGVIGITVVLEEVSTEDFPHAVSFSLVVWTGPRRAGLGQVHVGHALRVTSSPTSAKLLLLRASDLSRAIAHWRHRDMMEAKKMDLKSGHGRDGVVGSYEPDGAHRPFHRMQPFALT